MLRRDVDRKLIIYARDHQRGPLYQMEREMDGIPDMHTMKKADMQRLIRSVCRYYGVRPPKLTVTNEPELKEYGAVETFPDGRKHLILNAGFRGANAFVLLHELAHWIVDERYEGAEDHGPEMVAVYMHLLDKYKILPQDAFRVMARRWKVRIGREWLPGALRGTV